MDIKQLNSDFIDHRTLKSLSLTTDLDSKYFESNLVLCLCKDEYLSDNYVCVEFIGISNLKMQDIGGGLTQISHLNVSDVSSSQLDRIKYIVTDIENDRISFDCSDINIRDMKGA